MNKPPLVISGQMASTGLDQPPIQSAGTQAAGLWQVLADDLATLQTEAMGWIPLDHGAYLHQGAAAAPDEVPVIQVVGIAHAHLAAMNLLLLV